MSDTTQSARADLAFLKAVTEDRGPLPGFLGVHLVVGGLIFGAELIWIWWRLVSGADPNGAWMNWSWAPGALAYLPAFLVLHLRTRGKTLGPSGRVFGAAWATVGIMTLGCVLVVTVASVATGANYAVLWPPLALVLYSGAWSVVAIIRRRAWLALVAAGCLGMAVTCAALISTSAMWLAMGIGLLALMAGPGVVIMLNAPKSL
jgi:hypothetical protein